MAEAQVKENPFFFTPPWNILFELNRLANLRPWDISIAFLLTTFLEEMAKRGEVDFRASGVALDSSATIYLMKSKLLLKLEEPPLPPRPPLDNIPPPLFLPARYELTSTTVQEQNIRIGCHLFDHGKEILKLYLEISDAEHPFLKQYLCKSI